MTGLEKFKDSKGAKIGMIACALVALAGIAMWVYQCITGLHVTAMRDGSSWGLYITMFMFFVGLSAGGLIISTAPKVFGFKGFGNISKVAVLSSIVCTILAIGFVIVDLGHPELAWHLIVYGQLVSPLMWDMLVLTAYLILCIIYLAVLVKHDKEPRSERSLKTLSIIAFIVAILVHSVTAWIFSLNISRPFWNTALMAPWFVCSALVSGLALVLVITLILRKTGNLVLEDENVQKMGKLLGVFVAVDLFFFFCEILTSVYPGAGTAYEIIGMVTTGPIAPFFWTQVLGGIIAMILMFNPATRKKTGAVVVASILAILGIFCKRVQLIEGGFQVPNLTYPGMTTGPSVPGVDGFWQGIGGNLVYWPSGFEVGVTLGVLALGGFLLILGLRILSKQEN